MFKPGDPKPPGSGRQKGTKNKVTIPTVAQTLARLEIDPIKELLALVSEVSPDKQIDIWKTVMQYAYAKPREIEVSEAQEETDLSSLPSAQLITMLKA